MFDFFVELGIVGISLLIVLLVIIPIMITVFVGIALANLIGLSGLAWWCFVILFYLVISSIIGVGAN